MKPPEKMINEPFDPTAPNLSARQRELVLQVAPFYDLALELINGGAPPHAVLNGALGTAVSLAMAIDSGEFPTLNTGGSKVAVMYLILALRQSATELETIAGIKK